MTHPPMSEEARAQQVQLLREIARQIETMQAPPLSRETFDALMFEFTEGVRRSTSPPIVEGRSERGEP
jgi:hypothetical protein